MALRLIALALALVVATPAAALASALSSPPPERMGCCDADDEAPAHKTFERHCCCCDFERPAPTESQVPPAATIPPDDVNSPGVAILGQSGPAPVLGHAALESLPRPRGPPPPATLLLQKTSLVI